MASAKSVRSMQTMKWSLKEYSLEELVANYKSFLPYPVLVTSGCWIAPNDSVYWVRDVIDSSWIVVESEEGTRYKVPEFYDAQVIPIKPDGSEGFPFPFRNVREHGNYRYIRFVDPVHQVRVDVSGESSLQNLGDLDVVDVYDEVLLAVHPLHLEELVKDSSRPSQNAKSVVPSTLHLIPSSMPVTVSIGIALAEAPDFIYFHTMAEIKALAESYQISYEDHMKTQLEILQETLVPEREDYVQVGVEANHVTIGGNLGKKSRIKRPVGMGIEPKKRLSDLRHFFETEECDAFDASGTNEDDLKPSAWIVSEACPVSLANDGHRQGLVGQLKQQLEQNAHQYAAGVPPGRSNIHLAPERLRKPSPAPPPKPCVKSYISNRPPDAPPPKPHVKSYVSNRPQDAPPPKPHVKSYVSNRPPDAPLPKPHVKSYVSNRPPDAPALPSRQRCRSTRISRVEEIPDDVADLTVEELSDCLQLLNLSKYVPTFYDHQVDGRLLLNMKADHLISNFGFTDLEASKLIRFAQRGWRPTI